MTVLLDTIAEGKEKYGDANFNYKRFVFSEVLVTA
jgi:hypothetical protein